MRRSWPVVGALLAVALLPAAASPSNGVNRRAASPSSGGIRVLRTRLPVTVIAADGPSVAVATSTENMNNCDKIVVWSPKKRTSVRFNTNSTCIDNRDGNDVHMRGRELALAGNTVLWLTAWPGMNIELVVSSHTLGSNRTDWVSSSAYYSLSAYEPDDYGPYTFVANLFGAGNLLVYNSWAACMEIPAGSSGATCPQSAPGNQPVLRYSDQKLLKVVDGKSIEIASAPDTQVAATLPMSADGAVPVVAAVVAVDANRVALQYPDGSVTIFSADGAVLQSIPIRPGTFSGFALQGSQLVTIRNGKLELYDVASATHVKTIHLRGGSLLGGLRRGLAAYVGYKVHVVRLSDGKDVTFSPLRADLVAAQITASGLFYSYNSSSDHAPGRVVFVPMATVLKKLG
jgi:hypothetical protein